MYVLSFRKRTVRGITMFIKSKRFKLFMKELEQTIQFI